ncbi:MAG TPA: DNA internalization-related competence protein ComEC/Rec2 [Nitrospirales bacterium]
MSLLVGVLVGSGFAYFPFSILCVMILVLGGVLYVSSTGRCPPGFGCVVFGVFLFGVMGAALAHARSESSSLIRSVGQEKVDLVGVIVEPVRFGPDRAVAVVAVQRLMMPDRTLPLEGRVRLTIRGAVPPLTVGDLVEFETRLRPPQGLLNPGGYDYEAHLRRVGIHALGNITLRDDGSGLRVLARGVFPLSAKVDRWRGRIRDAALRTLPAPLAGIYLALVTGETGYLQTDIREAFMASGTTHILSISGSHLGLIGIVVFGAVRQAVLALPSRWLLRASRRITATRVAAVATILPVTLYALLGGAEVATVRSLVMILIVLAATFLGRAHSIGIGLALAFLAIVGLDPLAPYDISFQLSFLSVLVVLLVMRARHLPDEESVGVWAGASGMGDRLKRWTEDVLLVSVCVTVACAPLVAAYFNQVAWVGGFSNLLVVPFVGFLVLPAGLLACLVTLLSGSEELAGGVVIQALLEALVWVVQLFTSVPGAEVRVASPPAWQMAAFFLCLGAAFIWWRGWVGRIAAVLAAGVLLIWVWSPRDLPASGTVRVTFLDVGQGDAALIETPDGRTMLIDGGSASDRYDMGQVVVAPLLWDRGIRRLDVVVATHPQLDHVGGLTFVLRKFQVGELWTNGMSRDTAFLHRLEEVIRTRGVPVRVASNLDEEVSVGSCRVRVLNPRAPLVEGPGAAAGKSLNNQSVVLRLGCGVASFLFTGDVERETENELIQAAANLGATVLKVPHHGARGSVYEPFLEAVSPRLAVVSVGRVNPYGHPSPVMVETYGRLGIPFLRTDHHGAVTVVDSPSGLRVSCESEYRLRRARWGGEAGEAQNFARLLGGMDLARSRSNVLCPKEDIMR